MTMGRLSIEDVARRPELGMDIPAGATFAPDGRSIIFLRSRDGTLVRSLWRHDLVTGERSVLADPLPETTREETLSREEHLWRERTSTSELGITEFGCAGSAADWTLLVPMAGRIFTWAGAASGGDPELREMPIAAPASRAQLSPDSSSVMYTSAGDLYVALVRSGAARRLTDDGQPGVFNGLPEFIASEELDRLAGAWWSADSQAIAYAHVDERGVPPFTIRHAADHEPVEEVHHYPFPGGPNAAVTLRVTSATGGRWREVGLGMQPEDYLARVIPHSDGGWLAAVLPRDQRSLHWHRVAADGSAQPMWAEACDPWINLEDDTRVLPDGRILRSSERSGFRHLELRAADGRLERVLTAGDWMVTDVVGLSPSRREVLFRATRDGILERHLYAVSYDAAESIDEPERLTPEPGWHAVVASADADRWIDTWSDLEHAPRVSVVTRGGESLVLHESSTTAVAEGIDPPELIELIAADGSTPLHAAVYRSARPGPQDAPPPAVVWVYGGPHKHYVQRSWEAMVLYPQRHYLAQAGATVIVVDNRGTADRGVAFESAIHGRLGWSEIADQAGAVRQLADRGLLDPARVAIFGGSYGGHITIMAMALEPDLFRAGVAIAPVTEWTGYDTGYTERYLGLPAENVDGYRDSSPLTHASRVRGDLLLIHGAVDENVHLRHSLRMVEALRQAGRAVGLVTLPEQRHRLRGKAIMERDRQTLAHLLSAVGLPIPDELSD
jgi:dipeptidyl-peptidase-4